MTTAGLFLIAILIISVIAHEVAHGYAALALGDQTAKLAGRLTLNPLVHIDPFGSIILPLILSLLPGGFIFGWAKPVPYNPYNLKAGRFGPAIVAAAGPASNIAIAIVFGLAARFSDTLALPPAAVAILGAIVIVNLTLALFNLLPVPPLDGSNILAVILPLPLLLRFRQIGMMGIVLAFLAFYFLASAVSSLVIFFGLLLAGQPALTATFNVFFH